MGGVRDHIGQKVKSLLGSRIGSFRALPVSGLTIRADTFHLAAGARREERQLAVEQMW
jgi:hypothetical protein